MVENEAGRMHVQSTLHEGMTALKIVVIVGVRVENGLWQWTIHAVDTERVKQAHCASSAFDSPKAGIDLSDEASSSYVRTHVLWLAGVEAP